MEKPYGWFLPAVFTLRQVFFTHFASKNRPPGFSIIGTLAGNALIIVAKFCILDICAGPG